MHTITLHTALWRLLLSKMGSLSSILVSTVFALGPRFSIPNLDFVLAMANDLRDARFGYRGYNPDDSIPRKKPWGRRGQGLDVSRACPLILLKPYKSKTAGPESSLKAWQRAGQSHLKFSGWWWNSVKEQNRHLDRFVRVPLLILPSAMHDFLPRYNALQGQ